MTYLTVYWSNVNEPFVRRQDAQSSSHSRCTDQKVCVGTLDAFCSASPTSNPNKAKHQRAGDGCGRIEHGSRFSGPVSDRSVDPAFPGNAPLAG